MKKFLIITTLMLSACSSSKVIKQENISFDKTNFQTEITIYPNQKTSGPNLFKGTENIKSGDQYTIIVKAENFSNQTNIASSVEYFNTYTYNQMKNVCGSKQVIRSYGPSLNGRFGGNGVPLLVDDSIGYVYQCQ